MAVADSSFLVALFDKRDTHHQDARRRFTSAEHVIITTEILVETLGVLKTKAGRKTAATALEKLLQVENVGWEETCDLMAAYRIYHKKNTNSLTDAMAIQHCLRLDTELLTYDDKQARILEELQI